MVAELEPYRDYILTGNEVSLPRKPSATPLAEGGAGASSAQQPAARGRSPAASSRGATDGGAPG